jgi:hypothetical protein
MHNFKVSWCPICCQGWVIVAKDETTQELFLYCTECETEWKEPEYVLRNHSSIRNKYGFAIQPTLQEVQYKGWSAYLLPD